MTDNSAVDMEVEEDGKPASSPVFHSKMNNDSKDKLPLPTDPNFDWSFSPANHYIVPSSHDMNAIDSSLIPKMNEEEIYAWHHFQETSYKATGYSKLQVPDCYLELVSVLDWNNRNRLKKGDNSFTLEELESFL
jgi:hypothetical protein